MRAFRSRLIEAVLASTALVAAVSAAAAQEAADTHWRLFVGDHAEPVVRAFDVEDGKPAGTFRIDRTPALARSGSGRTVFAVQGEAGKVAAIDTGITFEDHGDHGDIHVGEAKLLPVALSGKEPAHLVENDGTIALFDDGTGAVSTFTENALRNDATFRPAELAPGAPHHGLAAPMGDHLVVSVPDADAEKPRRGLRVVAMNGAPAGEVAACPGVHGQASSGRTFAFGCKDGVVIAEPGRNGMAPTLRHLSTAALGEGNVSTLKGGAAMRYFLGNYGPRAMAIIEPDAAEPFRRIDLPTRRVDFALDPARPQYGYILTEDGTLHRLDVVSGEIDESASVTAPYSMDGHWREPRPRLAVAGDHVAVTDPAKGVIRLVSTDTLAETRRIPVDGKPFTIVAVGGSGAVH